MADAAQRKKGLTTFGWLLVGGAAAFLLSSRKRCDKAVGLARDFAARFTPAQGEPTPA